MGLEHEHQNTQSDRAWAQCHHPTEKGDANSLMNLQYKEQDPDEERIEPSEDTAFTLH